MSHSPHLRLDIASRLKEVTDKDVLDTPMAGSPVSPMPRATVVRDGSSRTRKPSKPTGAKITSATKLVVNQPLRVLHLCLMRHFEDKDEPGNSVVRNLRTNEIVRFVQRGQNNRVQVVTADGERGWVSTVHSSGIQILGLIEEEKGKGSDISFLLTPNAGNSPENSPRKLCKQD